MASETTRPGKTRRRDLILGLGALAAVGGGWQAWVHRPRDFQFTPIDALPGWRQLTFEGVSTPRAGLAGAALMGLDGTNDRFQPFDPATLCRVLFTSEDPGVPVAVFSDFFCPYCRTLVPELAEAQANGDLPVSLTWHELPLLSPLSEQTARAALSADLQGGYAALQSALIRGQFRPTAAYIGQIADEAGLNGPNVVANMHGAAVTRHLAFSRAAARTLGVYGTPALVVGRTLVMGAISMRDIKRLVEIEAAEAPVC